MFKAFLNIFKVKELRDRLLFTAGIIVLVRIAANIPCPGVDPEALRTYVASLNPGGSGGTLMNIFDMFSGGAVTRFAIGTLGIMPYITASIIMQLLVPVVPALEKIQRDGESGRGKINQYTRYLTIAVCLFQGLAAAFTMADPTRIGLTDPGSNKLFVGSESAFIFMTVVVLVATTMVIMWMGEQITDRGIGNGASIIITINIVARMPDAIISLVRSVLDQNDTTVNLVKLLLLVIVFFLVTAATVMLSLGYRRVPIQMARKTVGGQVKGGSTYMPLKVNFANVMPIIFAGALMIIPSVVFQWCAGRWEWHGWAYLYQLFSYEAPGYIILYGALIIGFSFFWVSTQFNPLRISDNLKKEGAYIPGIRPGEPTAEYLDATMTRVTFGGALFLTALALFPTVIGKSFGVPPLIVQFFGGTSLLIMVGVTLDTMRQMESHLTMRNYEGFLKSGRLRGRNG